MIVIRLNTPEQNGTSGSDDKRQRRYLPAHALPASAPAPQTNVEIKKMLGGSMRNASQHWTRGSGGLTPTPCPEVPFCSGLAARDSVSCLLLTARHSQTRAVSALTRPDCGSRTGPLTPHGARTSRSSGRRQGSQPAARPWATDAANTSRRIARSWRWCTPRPPARPGTCRSGASERCASIYYGRGT